MFGPFSKLRRFCRIRAGAASRTLLSKRQAKVVVRHSFWLFGPASSVAAAVEDGFYTRPSLRPRQAARSEGKASECNEAEIRLLEQQSVEACRCARRLPTGSPQRETCWSRFNRDLARYQHSTADTMCMPISPELVCFGGTGAADSRCIVKSYGGEAARRKRPAFSRPFGTKNKTTRPPGVMMGGGGSGVYSGRQGHCPAIVPRLAG